MKKLICMILTLAMMLTLIACGNTNGDNNDGGDAAQDEPLVIGWSEMTMDVTYYKTLVDAAAEAAGKAGYKFVSLDAEGDITKQIADVENLIAQDVDIIVIDAKDPSAIIPAVKSAVEAGIPVIACDSSMDEGAPVITTIQADNLAIGLAVGEFIAKTIGDQDIYTCLISGLKGNIVGQQRRVGYMAGVIASREGLSHEDAIAKAWELEDQLYSTGKVAYPESKLNIVSQGWGDWTNEGGLNACDDALTSNENINVVFAENDAMALGAVKSIEAFNKTGDILVAGVDAGEAALDLIQQNNGVYHVTGLNSPLILGQMTIETITSYFNGDDIPSVINMEGIAVTAENIAQYR